jgi:hypothetical protein
MFITAPTWTDRTLGTSIVSTILNRATVIICGNNVSLGGDLWRRVVWIRLDPRVSDPSRRTFARDLDTWGTEHRGRVLWAVYTIFRGWHVAGRPSSPVPAFAGFQGWAETIGGLLAFVGVKGFLENLDTARARADESTLELERFLRAWHSHYGDEPVRAAQVARDALADDKLRDALPAYLGECADERGERKLARRLGNLLRRIADRRFGDDCIRVEHAGADGHTRVGLWRVVANDIPASQSGVEASHATAPHALPSDDDRSAILLGFGRSHGFPRLPYGPGRAIAAGEEAWTVFVSHAPSEEIALAAEALRAFTDGPRRETS